MKNVHNCIVCSFRKQMVHDNRHVGLFIVCVFALYIVVACDCALDFDVGLDGHHNYWLVRRHPTHRGQHWLHVILEDS